MKEIRLKISDLYEIEPQTRDQPRELAAITAYVLKHYAFLPKPIAVTVDRDEVVISYPEETDTKREEAARLAARAVKRASEGNYQKAIEIYKRVLELQPSFHAARRDLAMAYMELGDFENATNHLIEVLRLDPKDAWSWVVLGNLYVREKADLETGEKFLRKALEIKPNDAWALNSLAAAYQKKGQTRQFRASSRFVSNISLSFTNARMIAIFTRTARSLFSTLESMATPSSVMRVPVSRISDPIRMSQIVISSRSPAAKVET
jgi:tetratricopeptide (TPR) repeat protein